MRINATGKHVIPQEKRHAHYYKSPVLEVAHRLGQGVRSGPSLLCANGLRWNLWPRSLVRVVMTRPLGFITALVLVLALAACGGGADGGASVTSTPPGFMVSGLVHAGPTCPVVYTPPDPACADRPVQDAVIRVLDVAGGFVAEIQTGEDGTFSVVLPPGIYTFVPQPVEGMVGTAPELEVVVGEAPVDGVDIAYDTGIR